MTTQENYLIETQNLTRIYGNGEEIRALDDVNIQIRQGELVSIMGPSGSGKSTLLNMLGALDKPTSGKVYVNQLDVAEIKDKDTFRSQTVGFIFQMHNLLPTMTAQENVEVAMMGHSAAKERKERALYLLELVGLSDRTHHLPAQLSGGQRQRVAVARSLANNPPLILADEPTGNLDSVAGQSLIDLIHEINVREGSTFVIVTHDPAVARQTNRVLVMADGKIIRTDVIQTPIEEDLKIWVRSELGKKVIAGDEDARKLLNISEPQFKALRKLLTDQHENGNTPTEA